MRRRVWHSYTGIKRRGKWNLVFKMALKNLQIPIEEIERELAAQDSGVNEKANLGCRVKFPIENVLEGVEALRESYENLRFFPREDVFIFDTDGQPTLHRFERSFGHMANGGDTELAEFVGRINPSGLVALLAFSDDCSFADKVRIFYDPLENSGKPIVLGKGHTIRVIGDEAEFGVLDFVEAKPGSLYGLANNDSIVEIDCKLPHSSWITVFTALNNALNDLFASGVYQGIRIFPTIAGRTPEETASLEQAVRDYVDRFSQCGFQLEEVSPLGSSGDGYKTKVVGATVIGTTDREVPRNEYLRGGQVLFATRPVGDLVPLAEYMALSYEVQAYAEMGLPDKVDRKRLEQLESMRLKILQYLVTPNWEAARIISQYLPKKGDAFDDARHITSSIDVSGPGIKTVAWLAQDSGNDIYLDNIVYHDPSIPTSTVHADQTAGTNGAIILAAKPEVAKKVMADLTRAGYEPWIVGRVGTKAEKPTIHINSSAILPKHASEDLGGYFGRFEYQH